MSNCAENPSMVWWSLCSLLFFLSFFFLLLRSVICLFNIKSNLKWMNIKQLVRFSMSSCPGNKWKQMAISAEILQFEHEQLLTWLCLRAFSFFLNPHNYLTYCLLFFFLLENWGFIDRTTECRGSNQSCYISHPGRKIKFSGRNHRATRWF